MVLMFMMQMTLWHIKFIFIVAIVEHLYFELITVLHIVSATHSLVTVPRPMKPHLRTYAAIFCVLTQYPFLLLWFDPADVLVGNFIGQKFYKAD